MISKRDIQFATTMASINAPVISFVLTVYNAGFTTDFLQKWGVNFLIAFTIVVPSILFIGPRVRKWIFK